MCSHNKYSAGREAPHFTSRRSRTCLLACCAGSTATPPARSAKRNRLGPYKRCLDTDRELSVPCAFSMVLRAIGLCRCVGGRVVQRGVGRLHTVSGVKSRDVFVPRQPSTSCPTRTHPHPNTPNHLPVSPHVAPPIDLSTSSHGRGHARTQSTAENVSPEQRARAERPSVYSFILVRVLPAAQYP